MGGLLGPNCHLAKLTVVVARLDGRVVGAAGLERYADGALLRSGVVDASARGQGVGQRLTEAALALAWTRLVAL